MGPSPTRSRCSRAASVGRSGVGVDGSPSVAPTLCRTFHSWQPLTEPDLRPGSACRPRRRDETHTAYPKVMAKRDRRDGRVRRLAPHLLHAPVSVPHKEHKMADVTTEGLEVEELVADEHESHTESQTENHTDPALPPAG